MRAKRLDHRAVFVTLAFLMLPAAASAQDNGKAFRLPPGSGSGSTRGVVQRAPQPQVIVVQPTVRHHGGFFHRSTVFPRQSSVIWVPAVVTSDGRVFANFGYGFEQVHRSCSSVVVVGQPSVIAGNGFVLSPQAPTYTQPVPNQQTASQQMAAGRQPQTAIAAPAYSTCFSSHSSNGVIVYRF
jgi:hypothetical protein